VAVTVWLVFLIFSRDPSKKNAGTVSGAREK